jgi:hypothetical protein
MQLECRQDAPEGLPYPVGGFQAAWSRLKRATKLGNRGEDRSPEGTLSVRQ